eukprot:2924192-Rhodomonas_salina.1
MWREIPGCGGRFQVSRKTSAFADGFVLGVTQQGRVGTGAEEYSYGFRGFHGGLKKQGKKRQEPQGDREREGEGRAGRSIWPLLCRKRRFSVGVGRERQGGCTRRCLDAFVFVRPGVWEVSGRCSLTPDARFPSAEGENNLGAEGVKALADMMAQGHTPNLD